MPSPPTPVDQVGVAVPLDALPVFLRRALGEAGADARSCPPPPVGGSRRSGLAVSLGLWLRLRRRRIPTPRCATSTRFAAVEEAGRPPAVGAPSSAFAAFCTTAVAPIVAPASACAAAAEISAAPRKPRGLRWSECAAMSLRAVAPFPRPKYRPAPANVNRPSSGSCHGLNLNSAGTAFSHFGIRPVRSHAENARRRISADMSMSLPPCEATRTFQEQINGSDQRR